MIKTHRLLTRVLLQNMNKARFTSQAKPESTENLQKTQNNDISNTKSEPNQNGKGQNTNQNGTPEGGVPKYNPIEYEIFKFPHERESLIIGYSIQEMYGKRYGLKHSPAIRREISKDNVLTILVLLGTFTMIILSRNKDHLDNEAWKEYYYHDMNYVRSKDKSN